MVSYSLFKNTLLFSILLVAACGNSAKSQKPESNSQKNDNIVIIKENEPIKTGADNYENYLPLLKGKKVGIVTNQTGVLNVTMVRSTGIDGRQYANSEGLHSIVDFLLYEDIKVKKIFAPEHGFRGTADAGELIKDGKDTKTGLPIISLYGNNKKPKPEQLKGIDVMVFDLQDVGARFYTYISSLHYVMEACAENNIPLIVLDRPNPNGGIVDGPVLEEEYHSFVGMHPIPVLHGMTIGEYAKMINGEKWLDNRIQCDITIIPCTSYSRTMKYSLPVKPSPNLPNSKAINLYPSLCFFEGTSVSVGRGTDKQFQIYGSPDLPDTGFSFIPMPNEGAKHPKYEGKKCYGKDLSNTDTLNKLQLKWLIAAYEASADKKGFFIPFFTKLAGTAKLHQQIINETSAEDIRLSWKSELEDFKKIRRKYLIYAE